MATAGARVGVIARGKDEIAETISAVEREGGFALGFEQDLTQIREIPNLFETILKSLGEVDILVNAAGHNRRAPAESVTLEDWQSVLDLNLSATFFMAQAFAKARIAAGKPGRLINIASLTSAATRAGVSPYTASKGGVLALTRALALDWAKYGVLVNAIGPGYIDTPLNSPLIADAKFDAWVKDRCPLGRWGTPEDIADSAVFLASDAASFITGQILYVDGGWLAKL